MNEQEQAHAQISQALGIQAAKRAARAARDNASPAAKEALRSGITPVYRPHDLLRLALAEKLGQFDRVLQTTMCGYPDGQHYLPRALAAVELLRGLIARLEGKTGERAESARAGLQSQLADIEHVIGHFRSLGTALDGSLAQALEQQIVDVRAAQAAAQAAKYSAVTRDEMREALLDIEVAEAAARAADKAIAEAVAGLRMPALPSADAVRSVEASTAALECLPRKPLASQIKKAIEEGEREGAQSYYACFEKTPPHPLCEWRWRGATGT